MTCIEPSSITSLSKCSFHSTIWTQTKCMNHKGLTTAQSLITKTLTLPGTVIAQVSKIGITRDSRNCFADMTPTRTRFSSVVLVGIRSVFSCSNSPPAAMVWSTDKKHGITANRVSTKNVHPRMKPNRNILDEVLHRCWRLMTKKLLVCLMTQTHIGNI